MSTSKKHKGNHRMTENRTEIRTETSDAGDAVYKTLLESTKAIPWKIDWATKEFAYIGPQIESLLGWTAASWVGVADWVDRMHADDRDQVFNFCVAQSLAGLDHEADYRALTKDGSFVWIRDVVHVVRSADGGVESLVGFMFDITERKRLEQQTREQAQTLAGLDKRKDEFLAMLAHELRNPLAAISSAVQLLGLQKHAEALQKQGRLVIERQVGQLTHLVDDLLDVSRITSGSFGLRQQQVSISRVVEGALETTQSLMDQHRHELTVRLAPQPIFLQADAARLEQVLVNLLNNAAKYTEAGGRIWLSVAQEGDAAVIRVRDSGIGIAPELLPHIFELFTQAERSLDRSQGGLGIGLSLVQKLVEMHGGTVEAHSVLGQGSEFVVRLPVVLALSAAPAAPPAHAASPVKKSRACRILIVDDNVDAAQVMTTLLELSGHELRQAHDGQSGLQAAMAFRPDVVLLDLGLPGIDGFEVTRRIRQQDALKAVVLVAVTGYGRDTDRQRAQAAGFDYHLVKPVDFDDIEKILLTVSEKVA